MSQENKNNKTMIGTMAPVIPRTVPPGTPGATRPPGAVPPPGTQPPATTPPASIPPGNLQQQTIVAPMAPGSIPPGAIPPASMPPGAMPPASIPPGNYQQQTIMAPMAPGSIPPASIPPASIPPASIPPASIPPGNYQQQTIVAQSAPPTVGMRPQHEPGFGAPTGGYPSQPGFPTEAGAPSMAGVDPDLFIGQELCGYTIKRKLAEGGMGVVFEGEHGRIGRRGAIKVLKLEFCRSEDVVERFRQEARAVNAIRHENIVDIYDFGRDQYGRVFFVMEYLEGEPLSSRIRRGALPWHEAFPILEQTLRALKAAHDKGFVHRDLKPDNIWLRYVDGRIQVKLLDFGIAKLVGSESPREKLTQTGSVIGTPHYMSPEQINGSRDVDQRTDIYAMGVITYEMFAGVTPFVGDTLQAIMTGHLFKEAPRLAEIPVNLGVPTPIAEIVDRMLVKDAAGRYDSVSDVLADLYDVNRNERPARAETLRRERPITTTVPGMAPAQVAAPAAPPRGKGKRTAAIIGAVAAAGLAVGGVAIWKTQGSEKATEVAKPAPPPAPAPGPAPVKPAEPVINPDEARKNAQDTLRAALREAEPLVRKQGSDALAKIKDQPSVPVLTELTEKDPDAEVRGHTGEALGTIGAGDAKPLLEKLEKEAPAPLKVWYASALARLGDKPARARLLDYARNKDFAVSFKAALTLADVSQPGDRQAIDALKKLATREAALREYTGDPYAAAMILTKVAALRDVGARKALYALLEGDHEGARLAAAEGLAKIGDDAGKKILQDALANNKSPQNQLVAAVAMIPLGEYGGFDLLTGKLADKDPDTRRLAARALGEIGERKSLKALIALASDKDWKLRIAASAAIVSIVGFEPQVLAQASVDWTKSSLESQDWAVRKAAAGVLADLPEKEAVPLLAKAIADTDPNVRLEAAKSAGKIKSPEAATKVADAAKAETDPKVKEQQVKALGEIGSPVVKDTLAQIAKEDPGRIGVIAAGSLVAVGDPSGKDKLEAAVAPTSQPDLRLAAVQAASTAKNPIVVPTLKTGVLDRVFEVRFTAAEGLSIFNTEKDAAVKVLNAALTESKDAGVLARATAALLKFGEKIAAKVPTPAEMIDSTDPKQRLAAVPIVRELPPAEGVPLLRRLVADPNQEVRRAGVDAIEGVATKDKDQAVKLYKPLVSDTDPVVRSKAQAKLAQISAPPTPTPPPPPQQPPQPAKTDPAPAADTALPQVQKAAADATAAAADVKPTTEALEAHVADIAATIGGTTHNDTTIDQVDELATKIRDAAAKLEAAAKKTEEAAKAAVDAAGASPSPDAAKLVTETNARAKAARDAANAARAKAIDVDKQARDYKIKWMGDPDIFISAADTATLTGDFASAKRNLDKAAKLLAKGNRTNSSIHYSYAQLYDKMAVRTKDPAEKRKLLQQAESAYKQFAKSGTGPRVQRAKGRAAELADDIKDLEQP